DALHEVAHGARARLRLPAHRRLDRVPLVGASARRRRGGRRGSVHLVGGGAPASADAPLYAPFVAEAVLRGGVAGRARPRIAVISLHPEAQEKAAALADLLVAAASGDEIGVQLTAGRPGEPIGLPAIADIDGIAVGGGPVEEGRA